MTMLPDRPISALRSGVHRGLRQSHFVKLLIGSSAIDASGKRVSDDWINICSNSKGRRGWIKEVSSTVSPGKPFARPEALVSKLTKEGR